MITLRPHQKEGAQYISKYGAGSSKGNFVSVACCVSSSHIKQGDATKDDVWFKTLSRSRRH